MNQVIIIKQPLKDSLIEIFAILLLIALPFVIGSCTYEETFECENCGQTTNEKYRVHDFDLYSVCPSCIDKIMLEIGSGEYSFCHECNDYYPVSALNEHHLCKYCSSELLSECWNCGKEDYCWEVNSDFFLCRQCISKASLDPRVREALQSAFN